MSLPDTNPLFLFPDILGNSITLTYLRDRLTSLNPKRKIHVWNDLRHKNDSLSILELSELATTITQGILSCLPPDAPCCIAGYSFGGTYMAEVINQLKAAGRTVFVYIIDSTSPAIAKRYFTPGNVQATRDLISIFDLIARILAIPAELIPSISAEEITHLRIEEQLNFIKDKCDRNAAIPPGFSRYAKIVIQNHIALSNYSSSSCIEPDGLFAAITASTQEKYGLSDTDALDGGWAKYYEKTPVVHTASSVSPITHCVLEGDHSSVMRSKLMGGQAEDIAESIEKYFKTMLQQHLLQKSLPRVIEEKKSSPIAENKESKEEAKAEQKVILKPAPITLSPKAALIASPASSPSDTPPSSPSFPSSASPPPPPLSPVHLDRHYDRRYIPMSLNDDDSSCSSASDSSPSSETEKKQVASPERKSSLGLFAQALKKTSKDRSKGRREKHYRSSLQY